jgi:hypothetical protein
VGVDHGCAGGHGDWGWFGNCDSFPRLNDQKIAPKAPREDAQSKLVVVESLVMEIQADATITYPRVVVYEAYREKITDLLSYLPNIRDIEVKSREQDGSIIKLVNIWHGGGDIPKSVRAFVSESMLSWTDYATWDTEAWTCGWRIETHSFTEAVTCKGLNHFIENGSSTTLQIRGEISVDASKVRGVPRLMAGKISKMVEEFLVARIRPNLLEVSEGLQRYFDENPPQV